MDLKNSEKKAKNQIILETLNSLYEYFHNTFRNMHVRHKYMLRV